MRSSLLRTIGIVVLFLLGTSVSLTNAQCTAPGCGACAAEVDALSCGDTCCGPKYIYRGCNSSLQQLDEDYLWTLGCGPNATKFKVGAWAEMGVFTNSHGATRHTDGNGDSVYGGNGPMHIEGQKRNDVTLQQLYFYLDKEIDTTCGWDWGFRTDMLYGADARWTQSHGDHSFDHNWGTNRHDYGLSVYQLYGTVGYKNLQVRGGKFYTPIGWEAVAARGNFFYSHSLCYYIEPGTHVGALADYKVNECLSLTAGWIAGNENGFKNRFDDKGFLFGLDWSLTNKVKLSYYLTDVETNNGFFSSGANKFDDVDVDHADTYIQSLCLEWSLSDRLTYTLQHNYRTDRVHYNNGAASEKTKTFGVNNHLIYQLDRCWALGARLGWLRDEGSAALADVEADYYEATLGVNYNPSRHWSFRPELRYDWCHNARPYADYTKSSQLSAGIGVLYIF